MAILSDQDIRKYLDEGKISIEQDPGRQIQPSSVDLRVGANLKVSHNPKTDPWINQTWNHIWNHST